MVPRDKRRLLVGGFVALAFVGLWLGHTVEYVRVLGTAGLTTELTGSVHAYMLPLGAALVIAAAVGGTWIWRSWVALGARLDRARAMVTSLLRGHAPATAEPGGTSASSNPPSLLAGVLAAWPALALLQSALYLVQENVEALAAGAPAPGFGAVTGVHALAPLVHAGVALVLVIAAAALLLLLQRRAREVAVVEAVVLALLRRWRGLPQALAIPADRDAAAPSQLLGRHILQRPPPALLAA